MVPMGSNSDEWIAVGRVVHAQQLRQRRRVRLAGRRRARPRTDDRSNRKTLWTFDAARVASVPRAARIRCQPGRRPRATTRHGGAGAELRDVDHRRHRRQPGMWFQVELPQPTPITEMQFESLAHWWRARRGGAAAESGYPREYVSMCRTTGRTGRPLRRAAGTGVSTAIRFAPVPGEVRPDHRRRRRPKVRRHGRCCDCGCRHRENSYLGLGCRGLESARKPPRAVCFAAW